jgi:hypothetical protein
MPASVRLRFVAIYFHRPPEVPRRQVKPWSQKIEPSTWLDPPIQTYNDVGPKWEGANHNMAEVGRFFESRRVRGPRSAGPLYGSSRGLLGKRWAKSFRVARQSHRGLSVRRADSQTAGIGE